MSTGFASTSPASRPGRLSGSKRRQLPRQMKGSSRNSGKRLRRSVISAWPAYEQPEGAELAYPPHQPGWIVARVSPALGFTHPNRAIPNPPSAPCPFWRQRGCPVALAIPQRLWFWLPATTVPKASGAGVTPVWPRRYPGVVPMGTAPHGDHTGVPPGRHRRVAGAGPGAGSAGLGRAAGGSGLDEGTPLTFPGNSR